MHERLGFDIDNLRKTFRYNNGKLERLNRRGNPQNPKWGEVNNIANNSYGYCCVRFNHNTYMYHSIIWTLYYNENIPEWLEIDHINGNRVDNRIENLRLVTTRQNLQNMNIHRKGKLVGFRYSKCDNVYVAQIMINKKHITLGRFKTKETAHEVYKIACNNIDRYKDNESFRKLVNNEYCKENK